MVVDHLNSSMQYHYNSFSRAKRDADAIASLEVLSQLNRLAEERLHKQQLMQMAIMRQQEERLLDATRISYAIKSPTNYQLGDDDYTKMLEGRSSPMEKRGRKQEPKRDQKSMVNVKKVEAALRSQPQRGEKRSNLTKEERNELIRARNRKHSRNTR